MKRRWLVAQNGRLNGSQYFTHNGSLKPPSLHTSPQAPATPKDGLLHPSFFTFAQPNPPTQKGSLKTVNNRFQAAF